VKRNDQVLHYWPFGESWCRIWLAVDVWMCTASIYNLVAISIDRYIAVSRPIRYASLMSPSRAKLLIVSVWILSFVICFPPLIGWNGGHGAGKHSAAAEQIGFNITDHVTSSSLSRKGLLSHSLLLYSYSAFTDMPALSIAARGVATARIMPREGRHTG